MSRPIDDLKHEHELIKRMLAALEAASDKLARGEPVPPDVLDEARDFVHGFADECHHGKEEDALVPFLAEKSEFFRTIGVRFLLADHEVGRSLMMDLAQATDDMRAGKPGAADDARRALDLYALLLHRHIIKEETLTFPAAEQFITPADDAALAERFDAVEARMGPDAHERYEAIVRHVESAVGVAA